MAGQPKNLPHTNTMAPLGTWLRLIWKHGVPPAYWSRLVPILVPSTLAAPLRLVERVRYRGTVDRVRMAKRPVFVLGVPRSGTTHLHNLLSRDPQYGSLSTFQAGVPAFFLTGGDWLKNFIAKRAPATRPMDAVRVSLDQPQEEDVAVANMCELSAVYSISFPDRAQDFFERYCFMRGLSAKEMKRWERTYMYVLRAATLVCDGKPLVLKSPVNTGRVPHLLRLFPEARFIHIVRNPYVVYESLLHMFRTLVPPHQLRPFSDGALEELALYIYREMTAQYLKDRDAIPEGQLTEMLFEDLERDPLRELEAVYSKLDLPGWERAEVEIGKYVAGLSDYRKNEYSFDAATVDLIGRECRQALDEWDYGLPGEESASPGGVGS